MPDRIGVVIVENELAERERLKGLLLGEADIEVLGEARDGKEAVEVTRKLRPSVVLLKEDLPILNGLAVAERIAVDSPETGVVLLLTGSEGVEVFHKMLSLRVGGFLTRPIAGDRLLEEVRKVAKTQHEQWKRPATTVAPEPESTRRRIISVAGPRGGCGKTVIAVNLAAALASTNEKIALVDLNLWGGDVAMLMDLAPRRTLGDLLPGFGGIDYDVVDNVMIKHSSGVAVLAAPQTELLETSTLSRYMVQSVLEALREHHECTVVDTGYPTQESTLAAMDYSDSIVIVIGMDLPRLRDGKIYLKNLLAANYPKDKLCVVVNRSGSSKEISPREVENILEFPVTAQLSNDESLVCSSVNLGRPFVMANPGRSLSRQIYALAETLAPNVLKTAGRKRTALRWLTSMG